MENPEKISLQFELLNTYYSKSACNLSHTPKNFAKGKLQYSRGGTGVSPWWYWSFPTVVLES